MRCRQNKGKRRFSDKLKLVYGEWIMPYLLIIKRDIVESGQSGESEKICVKFFNSLACKIETQEAKTLGASKPKGGESSEIPVDYKISRAIQMKISIHKNPQGRYYEIIP